MIRKLREALLRERLAVAELECLMPQMMCAAGVRGGALLEHCFFLKAVRRRPSKLNRGLMQLDGGAGLPAHAVRQGKRWLSTLLGNRPVAPRRHRPTSPALATDAFMYGWAALLFKGGGELCVAGGAWDREPHCISQGEARAVSLALSSFAEATPKNLRICIGNAAIMNIMEKEGEHSNALVRDPSLTDEALQEQGAQASWDCTASAENAANRISRGNRLRKADVAKRWHMRRGARKVR
ncbi:hypothetical protein ERJ75_001581900 [Trypanosoma vivax]|nr:putative protein kinase, putative,serine/threonine protein kinase [Trypanosoma vivax]KAH8605600.1 hypothetical protein ERJ75_001581900 [Trypanosoma vivax]